MPRAASVGSSLRALLPAALLISYCLYHSISQLKTSAADLLNSRGKDSLIAFEERLEPMRWQLSSVGCRDVGYITDEPETGDWFIDYFRTQHVLAPVIVHDSASFPFVVAIVHDPSFAASVMRSRRLSLVHDFGSGVLLLSNH